MGCFLPKQHKQNINMHNGGRTTQHNDEQDEGCTEESIDLNKNSNQQFHEENDVEPLLKETQRDQNDCTEEMQKNEQAKQNHDQQQENADVAVIVHKQYTDNDKHNQEHHVIERLDTVHHQPFEKEPTQQSLSIRDSSTETEPDNDIIMKLKEELSFANAKIRTLLNIMQTKDESQRKGKKKQNGVVQIFQIKKGKHINDVIKELTATLKSYQLNVVHCTDPREVISTFPLLIVIVNTTRSGADAKEALNVITTRSGANATESLNVVTARSGADAKEALKGDLDLGRAMLLIFHYMDIHASPVSSRQQILSQSPFQSLGGILDFAFFDEKGIYSCVLNQSSMGELKEFMRKFTSI